MNLLLRPAQWAIKINSALLHALLLRLLEIPFLKSTLSRYSVSKDKSKQIAWTLSKYLVIHSVLLCLAYLAALGLFGLLSYWAYIPQSVLHEMDLAKQPGGYKATFSIYNSVFQTNVCDSLPTSHHSESRHVCDNMHKSRSEVEDLPDERYNIKMHLRLANHDKNLQKGAFSVNSQLVNSYNQVEKINKISSFHLQEKKNILAHYWDKTLIFLGLRHDKIGLSLTIKQQHNNSRSKFVSLIAEIPEQDMIILETFLEFEVVAHGLRRFFHNYFYILFFLLTNLLAWTLFLSWATLLQLLLFFHPIKNFLSAQISKINIHIGANTSLSPDTHQNTEHSQPDQKEQPSPLGKKRRSRDVLEDLKTSQAKIDRKLKKEPQPKSSARRSRSIPQKRVNFSPSREEEKDQ